jgi:hypothetical protein
VKAGLEETGSDCEDDDEGITLKERQQRPSDEWQALMPFKDIYKDSPLCRMAFEYGPSVMPLSAVGTILNYIGNHLLHYIHTVMRRRIFFPCHRVTCVQMMPNGDVITHATRREVKISFPDENDKNKFEVTTISETQVQFKSKAVVISHGGR